MQSARALPVIVAMALVLSLVSCAPSEDTSGSNASSSRSSTGATEEAYQDTVETRRPDLGAVVLDEQLREAADSGGHLALDIVLHRAGETIAQDVSRHDGDFVVAFAGEGEDVAFEIRGSPQVFGGTDLGKGSALRGTFEVEVSERSDGVATYALTRSGSVDSGPRKGGEMCQSEGVDGRAAQAASALQDASIEQYRELRDEWAAAPLLWAAIKGHAANDEERDDVLNSLCSQHRE